MSDEENVSTSRLTICVVIVVGIVILGILLSLELSTVEPVKVTAPCYIIKNHDYAVPDNVIHKGIDFIRNDTGHLIDEYCYYLKDSGIVQSTWYGWNNGK